MSGDLYRPGHPGFAPQRVFREARWKEIHADYEGDAFSSEYGPADIIVLDWNDATETPSEAIVRLNREVMEIAEELRAIKNVRTSDTPLFKMWYELGQLNLTVDSAKIERLIKAYAETLGIREYVFFPGGYNLAWKKKSV